MVVGTGAATVEAAGTVEAVATGDTGRAKTSLFLLSQLIRVSGAPRRALQADELL
jgi:hypothetical protein